MTNYIEKYSEIVKKVTKKQTDIDFVMSQLKETLDETNGMNEKEQEKIVTSFMDEVIGNLHSNGKEGNEKVSSGSEKERSHEGTREEYNRVISEVGNLWLDDMTDDMYLDNSRVGEHLYNQIHMKIRDICIREKISWRMQLSEIALKGYLNDYRKHKLLERFNSLPTWDGIDRIGELASYMVGDCRVGMRRALEVWMSKCFERVINHRHNVVMVLKGKENIRKSSLVRFLASPFSDMYAEAPVRPASKDDRLARMSRFIQEIPELHDSMNSRNMNSFKTFLTEEKTTDRKPYDHTSIEKPNNCNYIATANEDGHLFQDVDGLRRFMVIHVSKIDFRYEKIDVSQLWAQAREAWKQGKHEFTEDEMIAKKADIADETSQDPVHEIMDAYIVEGTEEDFLPNIDIMNLLRNQGIQISNRSQETSIGSLRKVWFGRKGVVPRQKRINEKMIPGFYGFKIIEK